MRRLPLLMVATLAAWLAVAASGPPSAESAHDFSSVTTMIQAEVTAGNFPGASMLIVKDRQPIYEQHFGTFGPGTQIPIASASKWMSGAVIMSLVDDGAISLDDTVAEYLPGWTGQKGSITIRQLFSHTSGLPPDHACLGMTGMTLEQCVDQIAQLDPLAPPGTMFWYGGASMQVAGRIAEVASGKTWAQLFADQVKTPLGMNSTFYWPIANPQIGGGVLTTMGDYAKMLQVMHQGGVSGADQILSGASVAAMEADQTGGVPIWYSPHFDDTRYGVGVWRDIVGAGGQAVQVSSQGKFAMSPWLDRERRYYAIFFVQDDFVGLYSFVHGLQAEVRGIIDAYDSDGDGQGDGVDPDDDNDGQADASDGCAVTATTWTTPAGDLDCDGFPNTTTAPSRGAEAIVGTDAVRDCPATTTANDEAVDAWPPDVNDSQAANLSDVIAFGPWFNQVGPNPPNLLYNKRFDLNASGAVDLSDVVLFGPFFNRVCVP
jgi:CubicO group peptidase (beta-lactamase class C family)